MKHLGLWYVNKSNCKECLLHAAEKRAKKFTRISAEMYEYLNAILRGHMQQIVAQHPTLGKTLYPPVRTAQPKENQ